ncbi:MAG: insulinase family protein [Verrucomicrobia bacterium]|nr:insulinase family protein [Verrucomicrobiota bacterium]
MSGSLSSPAAVPRHAVARLGNGLTVATAAMPHMASVSLGIWVGVGGRYEPAALSGISHFIEHMLFKGTATRSAREISHAVEGVGGYLNAFTAEENTCFYAKAHHDRFPELLDVLMDMFLHSRFDRREIGKERSVIKDEIAMYRDQPHQQVHDVLNEALWPDHPLGRALTGTEATIDRLTRAQMLGYQRRNYVAPGMVICAAGNLDHARLVRRVSRYARHLPQGRRPAYLPASDSPAGPCVRLHPRAIAQMQIALGIRTCSRRDPRRFALRLLNTVLGENMSSRLFQTLREDFALAYSIQSSLSLFDDVGAMVISAGLDADRLPQALRRIMRELRRIANRPPDPAEMRRARDYMNGQIDLGLENTENQMMWLGEQLLAYGRVIPASHVKRRLAEVTAAQIRAVARDFFRPERLCLAVVSPLKTDPGLSRWLRL